MLSDGRRNNRGEEGINNRDTNSLMDRSSLVFTLVAVEHLVHASGQHHETPSVAAKPPFWMGDAVPLNSDFMSKSFVAASWQTSCIHVCMLRP